MQLEVLVLQTNRLFNNYSTETTEKKRQEKIDFLRNELENINSEQFRFAVDSIIRDENIKRFPTLAQIKAYLPKNNDYKSFKDCDRCRDGTVGVWIYKKEFDREYSYTFRCPFCEAGRNAGSAIPILSQEYHSIPYEKLREKNNKVVAAVNQ